MRSTNGPSLLGESFAGPAAIAVLNAQILSQSRRLAAQLQQALLTRPVIDQAIGILRSRSGDTAEQAFDALRRLSQQQHVKLADVAGRLVDEAAAAVPEPAAPAAEPWPAPSVS